MGQLVFQATAGGQTALVGPNPATNFSLNVPAVNGTLVTTGDTGTVTNTMLASSAYTAPGTIGSGTPNTGAFTSLSASTSITNSSLTAGRVVYTGTGGLESASANLTFNGTTLTVANDASISGLTVGKGGGSASTNTALGVSANALNNGSYAYSTAIGYQALYTGGGSQDTALGYKAGYSANTSSGNGTYIGYYAGQATTTGGSNVAVGHVSLGSNTTGSNNIAIGEQALYSNTTASNNTAVGYQSLYSNTTTSGNTAVGYLAGYYNTGVNNAYIGLASGNYATGNYNTAVGAYSYAVNNSGASGSYNTSIGYQSLFNIQAASNNTSVGYQAGYAITTGGNNTCLGTQAGQLLTTGSLNTLVGLYAGDGPISLTTGSQNTLIGYGASTSGATDNYELVISTYSVAGKGSSTGFIGVGSGGSGNIYQGNNSTLWAITSDQRLKKNIVDNNDGLDKITQIKVRNFEYRTADEVTELPKENAINIAGVQLGAIAQELIEVLPDCVKTESTGVMSVDASNITWHLINAVKELNAKVTALEAKLGA